mgnify:CR=1 FL=1
MCTAVSVVAENHYFGRNLDLERSYNESVVMTPRNFCFPMRCTDDLTSHYAMIGMAHVVDDFPLYFDAVNEKGLAMAGLNFFHSAHYAPEKGCKNGVAPYEFIPWVLGQCATLAEAASVSPATISPMT